MTQRPGSRLLIVDDDPAFRRTLKRAMERRGFEVTAEGSGDAALAAIDRGGFQTAIFEMRHQMTTGLALTERLRAVNPDARILILTGYGSVETAVAAAKLGVTDYLAKPARADVIEAVLSHQPRHTLASHTFLRPEEQEFNYLLTMFEQHDRNMSETARAIGMHRRTLQRILRRHGIAPTAAPKDEPVNELRRLRRLVKLWRRLLEGPDYDVSMGGASAAE
jgi:two-component system, response regulator RegA